MSFILICIETEIGIQCYYEQRRHDDSSYSCQYCDYPARIRFGVVVPISYGPHRDYNTPETILILC